MTKKKTVPRLKKKKQDWSNIPQEGLAAALNWHKMAPAGYLNMGTKGFDESNIVVTKDARGDYRWVLFSSNAYEDRDREVVSLAALQADVERTDKDADFGPLRWWHVGSPDPRTLSPGPGLDIGTCDFSALHNRVLIESGTFHDPAVARKMARNAGNLLVSLGFFHPASQPDQDGIFTSIRRFERSLLPIGRASNPYTSIPIVSTGKESRMIKEKLEALTKILGGDEESVQLILDAAEKQEAAAQAAGARTKEVDETTEESPESTVKDEAEETEEVETEEVETEEVETDSEVADLGPFVGDMAPNEFAGLMVDAMTRSLAPVMDVVKELQTGQAMKDDALASVKEATQDLTTKITSLSDRVGDLEGSQPKMLRKGYRASEDEATETTTKDEDPEPGWDPEFTNFLVGEQQ